MTSTPHEPPPACQHCTSVGGGGSTASTILALAVFAVLVLAPIATSVYLARRPA